MRRRPLLSIPRAAEALGLSAPTVTSAVRNLTELGVVTEATGRERHRIFVYREYLDLLNEGTELPFPA